MPWDNRRDLERNEAGNREQGNLSCPPLGLIKSSVSKTVSRWWRPQEDDNKPPTQPAPVERRYVHVPTHAASSFLKTTTTSRIRKANEVL
ncbi:hypothetical protein B0T17DRAFT_328054 [Bombardia bombarda]|uniref:Uncharacterized protein n=1 Tax=Bombardia bombarda TaxID=252184 RepID=A0AA39WMW1_9PEZI|nr:hypothetical protein B0T17DRAFT_328054 [Bombardia bombarda]